MWSGMAPYCNIYCKMELAKAREDELGGGAVIDTHIMISIIVSKPLKSAFCIVCALNTGNNTRNNPDENLRCLQFTTSRQEFNSLTFGRLGRICYFGIWSMYSVL